MLGEVDHRPKNLCRPISASVFEIEHSFYSDMICVETRRFGFDHVHRARLEVDCFYVDFSLLPRSTATYHIVGGGPLIPGEIVFLPEGTSFDSYCAPGEHRLLCLAYEGEHAQRAFGQYGQALHLSFCHDVRSPRIRQALSQIAREISEPGFGSGIVIEALSQVVAVELVRLFGGDHGENDGGGKMADWKLRRLKERIRESVGDELSIPQLATEIGMSPRHLTRTFKNSTNMTLSAYIAEARIDRAKRELARADAMIKVVAGECGFQNASAFSSAFRSATGLSPKQYRDECFRLGRQPAALC